LSYLIPFKLILLAFYTVCSDLRKLGNPFHVGDGSVIIFQFNFFTTNKWTPSCTNEFWLLLHPIFGQWFLIIMLKNIFYSRLIIINVLTIFGQRNLCLCYFLQCGSGRSVAPIKAGFVARVGRRNTGTWFGPTSINVIGGGYEPFYESFAHICQM